MRLNVLYQFDERYAPYAGVSIYSLLKNNVNIEEIYVYAITNAVNSADVKKIKEMIQSFNRFCVIIDANSVEKKLNDLNVPSYRGSQATNFKLFLSEYIPEDVHRILYIDSDTIVSGNLSKLMEIDMGDCPIAAVQDSVSRKIKVLRGFNEEDRYYNAGVVLFNKDLWDKDNCQKQILDNINETKMRYAAPDQDLLNIVFKNHILELPIEYNLQATHVAYSPKIYFSYYPRENYYTDDEIDSAVESPIIMHTFRFVGEFPWHKGNVHPQTKYFDRYLSESPWNDYVKKSSNVSMIYKVEKILYKILPKKLFFSVFNIFFERYQKKMYKHVMNGGSI